MTFKTVSVYFSELEKISSRLAITEKLAELFQKTDVQEIAPLVYLAMGKLAPSYEKKELQMAEKLVIRVLSRIYLKSEKEIVKLFQEQGDLGIVGKLMAYSDKKNTSELEQSLSILQVYSELLEIAETSGIGSVEQKLHLLERLLLQLDPVSFQYVVRIVLGTLRLKFSDMTVLDALSWMISGDKQHRVELERAYNVCVDIGAIATTVKRNGIQGLKKITATPGIPIRPQRAERVPDVETMLEKLGNCVIEPKLDGFRAQVHVIKKSKIKNQKSKIEQQGIFHEEQINVINRVVIFSRSLENITHMFPEIVSEFEKLPITSGVFDGEAIGYDPKTGKHVPFQDTIQRKRKHEVSKIAKTIPLRYYIFDLLSLNGTNLLDQSFRKRRKILEDFFNLNQAILDKKTIRLTPQAKVSSSKDIISIYEKAIQTGYEGVMGKKIDSVYTAGARNYNWVKFKHEGEGKLADTLDCIVMGYYSGQGKRSGFGIGAFLVGIRQQNQKSKIKNKNSEEELHYLTVAKIGTGLTDKQWQDIRRMCGKYAVNNKPEAYDVPKSLIPDVWVSPEIVVEIAADEITKTPLHSAGLALRFPRLVSFREDKQPNDATTIEEIQKLFSMQ